MSATDFFDPDLTAKQVAKRAKRHISTVLRLMRTGQMPGAYQITKGGPWRIPEDDFRAWQRSLAAKPVDPYRLEPPIRRKRAS